MKSLLITAENLDHKLWDEDILKFCEFQDFEVDGQTVESDFAQCTFRRLYWYWGNLFLLSFVACEFEDCTFAGTSFSGSRFVECTFKNCTFIKDSLLQDCDFEGTVAYGCTLLGDCSGFAPERDVQTTRG